MKGLQQLEEIRQTIHTLESIEESTTEPFRIVILTLKQKERALEKEMGAPNN